MVDALVGLEHAVAEIHLFEWPLSSANGVHERSASPLDLSAMEDLQHRLQAAEAEARQGLAAAEAAKAASAVQRENAAELASEAERARDEAVAVVRAEMDEMEARLMDAAAKAVAAAHAKMVEEAQAARTEAVAEAIAAQVAAQSVGVDLDDLVALNPTGSAADMVSTAPAPSSMVEAARVAQEKAVAESVPATQAENAAQAQGAGAASLAEGQLDWAQERLALP